MKQSYCGLCETCLKDDPDFLDAVARVKECLDQFPTFWWSHCFPGDEGFSFPEFRQGLDWFLSRPECPGCKGGGGLPDCPIKSCAQSRDVGRCLECHDLENCDHYNKIMQKSPVNIIYLYRHLVKKRFCNT